ncbi:MAG: NADH-quinone oxidoreductase subunit F [Actinobacteria bacterium]|nr:NADH-quinone oxidoreductase subunit F [Actinomycetota bacterium]
MTSRPGLPGYPAEDRPFTRAMRADGRPATIDDYIAAGGYEGLRRALDLEPGEITSMVTESGLRGRGGAGYSTGRKWSTMPLGPDAPRPKYIVCNADEMEPGSFKDRFLMERNPHLLLEGMLLAALATESDAGYIFLRQQYDGSAAALEQALAEARGRSYLGKDVLGSGFPFDIQLHESIGRYICGEASAMLNALESQRPNPRARPPHMTGAGLFSRPTVVNNVETYMAVPAILRHGPDWWKGLSVTDEGGTKVFGVAGRVAKPGCVELPMGVPMRELIEVHAGGLLPGYGLRAVCPGGASTAFVAPADLDVPLGFSTMGEARSRLGTGTLVLLDDQTCPVGMLVNMLQFFAQESCGWCTPCREGLQWMASLLEDLEYGRGEPGDIDVLAEGVWFMESDKCFCDLAPGAMQPLESALRLFPEDFARHVEEGGCSYRRRGSDAPAMRGTTW